MVLRCGNPVPWTVRASPNVLDNCIFRLAMVTHARVRQRNTPDSPLGGSHTGLIGFDVGAGSFFVRPELLRLLKRGNNRDANQDDLALAV